MFPPSQGLVLDIDAISQICGSVSIACWIVVFSPQIIENWRRGSADGLSIVFIVVWLLGDLFNILGAVMQGVLPTMIILAVYYTFADIVLLLQCFYYRGFTFSDEIAKPPAPNDEEDQRPGSSSQAVPDERAPLLSRRSYSSQPEIHINGFGNGHLTPPRIGDIDRRHSHSSLRERLLSLDGTHLSPVTPFVAGTGHHDAASPPRPQPSPSLLQTLLFNAGAVLLVCASGVLGWYLSARSSPPRSPPAEHDHPIPITFNTWGQIFGYICALLYLGSRIPQLLLNYRRKSTEGISMLFFLFACIGNLTYVLSILAYEPVCVQDRGGCAPGERGRGYGRYIAVNFSWLLGSFGTLLLDAGVFVQYFLYKKDEDEEDVVVET